jgi:hypothetical protein
MGKLGIKLSDVSATGLGNISKIANSRSFSELGDIADEYLGGDKITGDERTKLKAAQGGQNMEGLRNALVQIAAKYGQESTPGSELRSMAASLDNIKTILADPIAIALRKLAGLDVAPTDFKPDWSPHAMQDTGDFGWGQWGKEHLKQSPASVVGGWSKAFDKQFLGLGPDAALAKALAANESGFDQFAHNPKKGSTARGLFQFTDAAWKDYGAGGNAFNPDDQAAALVREFAAFRAKGATTETQLAMGHHHGIGWLEGHLFDPPDALAQKEANEASAARGAGYGAVDVHIKINDKPAQTIRAPLAAAPPTPAGGMPIAVPP